MSRIFDIDNWREIGATLGRNKTRTALTAFGIFWGTAMLAMLLGGAGGLQGMISRQFDGFSTNMAFMWAQSRTISFKGYNKGSSWTMDDRDIEMIRRNVTSIDASSGLLNQNVSATYKDKSKNIMLQGVESDYFKIQIPILYDGRLFNETDDRNSSKVALIGRDLANEWFGTENPVGKYVTVGGVSVKIVGIVGQKSEANMGGRLDENIIIPFNTMRRAFNMGNKVWFFTFTVAPGKRVADARPQIERVLFSNHPLSPDDHSALGFHDISENFEMVENLFIVVTLLAAFVGAGTLIAGVVGVGNIMWIIVKERTQEIGIRRAIGARPSDIITQVLAEGTVLTTVAGLAGISFATLVLAIAAKMTYDPVHGPAGFELSFGTAIGIVITFIVLGSAAGLIPAFKAMKIKPIEAINDK